MQILYLKNKDSVVKLLKITAVIFFVVIFLKTEKTLAAEPVLHFSDITSGPKTGLGDGLGSGAIVTVWGNNLGNTQGTSTIQVGGVPAAHVYEWANATQHPGHPSDLYIHHKMQVISFSVPAEALDGENTISVTVNGVTSNTLPFTVRSGNIYYVKSNGNNNAAGTWNDPWATIQYASDGLAGGTIMPGDIIYVGNIITESPINVNYPSGTTVTELNPIAMIAYPGKSPIMNSDRLYGFGSTNRDDFYFHISKFKFTGNQRIIDLIRYGRFIANEITDHPTRPPQPSQLGVIESGCDAQNNNPNTCGGEIVYGNYIHDCQQGINYSQMHTFYWQNRTGSPIDPYDCSWNYLKNNDANHGIHNYDEGDCGGYTGTVYIHNNFVVDQSGISIGINTSCAEGYQTTGAYTNTYEVYNNVIIRSGRGPERNNGTLFEECMHFGSNTPYGADYTVNVYNNTCSDYSDLGTATVLNQAAIGINQYFRAINLSNNLINNPDGALYYNSGTFAPTFSTNNLWYTTINSPIVPPWDTNSVIGNPHFTNEAGEDLSIQSNSVARDAGIAKIIGTLDAIATSRPQGNGWDIGAYEYVENQTIRADVDNNSTINTTDAMLTLRNSLGLSMSGTNWYSSTTTGDVNCDGNSNSTDAMLILRHSLGLDMSGTGWCE